MKRLTTALFLGGLAAVLASGPSAEAACPTILVNPVSLPSGALTQSYSQSVTQTGGTGVSFSITGGVLPTGLAIDGAGNITGTPTALGSFAFTATATDSTGCTGGRTFLVAINQAPAITSSASTTFQPDGTPKSFTVTTTGVPTPALSKTGTFPASITFTDNGNGTASIAGTPTAADVGGYPITITANNGVPPNATQNFTLNITCPVITVSNPGATTFTVGQALAGGVAFTQSGGTAGGTFAIATGSLPSGVSLSAGGTLSGTPTQTGTFPITVRYTALGGCTGTSATYNLQINCPTITVNPSTLVDALFGQPYGPVAFSQTGSTGSSFTWTSSTLPGAGLTFSTGGSLSGTPTNTGQQNITFTVTDNFSCQGQRTINGFAARPVANPDTFNNGVGSTQYVVAAADPGGTPHVFVNGSVLANDASPAGTRTATPANPTVGGIGGTVSLAPDGTFTYTPPLNATGAATFNYTLTDVNGITNTGLVTVNLANVVWYVTSGGTGDGRSHSPLGSVSTAATTALANHFIFVHSPSGTPATFAGAVTLKSGQTIWGQGTAFTLGGLTINPAAPTPTKPVIQGTLNLATGVTVSSLDVNAGASNGIVGTGTSPAHLNSVTIKNNVVVTTTTGMAVSLTFVDSTTGAGNGINFLSVSANGAANGISLSNTTGNFVVTGVGTTAGSGGTIQNISGRGASFVNAAGINLRNMNINNTATSAGAPCGSAAVVGANTGCNAPIHLNTVNSVTLDNLSIATSGQQGINGIDVTGFSLSNSSLSGLGNAADEDGLHFHNMLGTSTISNTSITSSGDDNVNIQNRSATASTINITGGSYNTGVLGSGLLFGIRDTANTTINVTGVTVNNNFSGGVVADGFDTATLILNVTGSTITNNNDGVQVSANNGLSRFDIDNNGFSGQDFLAVTLLKAAFSTGGTLEGAVRNNSITIANGRPTDAISVFQAGGGALRTAITTNVVNYGGTQRVILIQAGQDGNGSLDTTVTGNTMDVQLDGAGNAVTGILAQSAITGPGNTAALCADMGGAGALRNTFTHSLGGNMAAGDIRVRQRNDGTVRLPGYVGAATDLVAVVNYLNGRNTLVNSPVATATADSSGFAGGAACQQPIIP